MSEVVAALDAGTNTLRLLIARQGPDGRLVELDRQLRFARLGEGVDASGRLTTAAIERAAAAITDYLPLLAQHGVTRARFVATSASRDARNRGEFFDRVRELLGIEPEVISGQEESQLSFSGAISGARLSGDPVLVVDSGGGSTELVRGLASGEIEQAVSIDIGSRRVRERHLSSDPPTSEQVAAARQEVNRLLDACPVALTGVRTFIGVAGTVTSMAALHLGLTSYDRDRVDGTTMAASEVTELTERLLAMPVAELAVIGPVAPERAQVLCAGALVVDEITRRVGGELQASESDILDGIVWSMLRAGKGHPMPG